jgi:hypothetical protein
VARGGAVNLVVWDVRLPLDGLSVGSLAHFTTGLVCYTSVTSTPYSW